MSMKPLIPCIDLHKVSSSILMSNARIRLTKKTLIRKRTVEYTLIFNHSRNIFLTNCSLVTVFVLSFIKFIEMFA